jgi:hypothetical protein
MFDGDYMQSFIETQILPVQLKLNQNGCIVFYVYDGQDLNQSSKRSKINIEAERKNYFRSIEGTHYKELQIPSAFAPDNHDIIGVITKL